LVYFRIVLSADKKNGSAVRKQERLMDFPIPMRCYTCNLPLAGKWKRYLELVKQYRRDDKRPETDELVYLSSTTQVTAEGRAMTDLGLVRECCRRHLLTHPGV
jgi:DNA-directed RNA polymerase subunit N (RpoN/RPB10)